MERRCSIGTEIHRSGDGVSRKTTERVFYEVREPFQLSYIITGDAEVVGEVVGAIRKKSVVVIGGGSGGVVGVRLMKVVVVVLRVGGGGGRGGVAINGENFVIREIEKIINTKQVRC